MWNLKHGGGQPSGRSYRRGEKQKAASDLSDSPSSAGSESCASEAPRAAVAASDFLGMSGAGEQSTAALLRRRVPQKRLVRFTVVALSLAVKVRDGWKGAAAVCKYKGRGQ
ncbi:uncharacterized protein VSU04_013200 isoform 1-T1 [Chlamydotis macqueenii]